MNQEEKEPLIFSVDTSSDALTFALGTPSDFLAGQTVWARRAHQARLHPLMGRFLESAGVEWKDIACLGIVTGPGSFTGLRIGVTAVKGLAWALGKPVVAVSALDALAENLAGAGRDVVPVIDAKRDRVYTARYRPASSGRLRRIGRETAVEPHRLAARIPDGTALVGDGAARYISVFGRSNGRFVVAPRHLWTIQPASLWSRSVEVFERKRFVSVGRLEPAYLRLPEAVEKRRGRRPVSARGR